MSTAITVFDEIADIMYVCQVFGDDDSYLEKKLLEMREKNVSLFDRVFSALLRRYDDVEDFLSEEFRQNYLD